MSYDIMRSAKVLELNKVLQMLAERTSIADAYDKALALCPSTDYDTVLSLLKQTEDAYMLISRFGSPSFVGAKNNASSIAKASVGSQLTNKDLLDIADTLRVIRIVKDWKNDNGANIVTSLDEMFSMLCPNKFLEDKIYFCIKSEEELNDNASPTLADLRRKIKGAQVGIRQRLDNITKSQTNAKYLQDAIITQRDGRFVVPVKAEYRSLVPGLVHDVSSSGATLFVEPMAVVEANNELKILKTKELDEINRILAELSALAAEYADAIKHSYNKLVELNLIFAKADFAFKTKSSMPKLNRNGIIYLKNARHPLIDNKKIVPITVGLGKDYDTLVITGPNTGGKTVTLKTVGLFTLMAMCGLMLPVDDNSEISVFDYVLADIGDEQSIEHSLSTFSSHMKNIISILENSSNSSLVLLDELCAGTDPLEGAALAKSILIKLKDNGAKTVATTHYAELKSYALDSFGVENASCEFDVESLKPTYRLIIGTPGRSNAFAISQKLGLDNDVVTSAKAMMSEDAVKFEKLAYSLEKMRNETEKKLLEINQLHSKLKSDTQKLNGKLGEAEAKAEKIIEKARMDASYLIDKTRTDSSDLLSQLEDMRKKANSENAAQMVIKARATIKGGINALSNNADPVKEFDDDYVLPRAIVIGDNVSVKGLNIQGVVEAIDTKKNSVLVVDGIIKTWVNMSDIRLKEQTKPQNKSNSRRVTGVKSNAERDINGEIDIRGMASDEGLMVLDKYIDEAVLTGIGVIRIIHGKGTGVLRAAVQKYLKSHKSVKFYRSGIYGEGENGVTIAELK